jgi:hypothetical protein
MPNPLTHSVGWVESSCGKIGPIVCLELPAGRAITHNPTSPGRGGGIGRRTRLKIWRWQHRGGSIPPPGTRKSLLDSGLPLLSQSSTGETGGTDHNRVIVTRARSSYAHEVWVRSTLTTSSARRCSVRDDLCSREGSSAPEASPSLGRTSSPPFVASCDALKAATPLPLPSRGLEREACAPRSRAHLLFWT